MNFFPQFRRNKNPHASLEGTDVQAVRASEGFLIERSAVSTQPPAFAYIATTDAVLGQSHHPVVLKDHCQEDEAESESQPVQDPFLGELLGLLFLVAFHGSAFVLKHVYVIALTLLSYVDHDIEVKYIKGA